MRITVEQLEPKSAQERILRESIRSFRELQDRLQEQRSKLRLSQADLADRMGITQPRVSVIESAQADIRVGTLQALAAALGGTIRFEVVFADIHDPATETKQLSEKQ